MPGPGFLFILTVAKGPVASISYLPFPNPKPVDAFGLKVPLIL